MPHPFGAPLGELPAFGPQHHASMAPTVRRALSSPTPATVGASAAKFWAKVR